MFSFGSRKKERTGHNRFTIGRQKLQKLQKLQPKPQKNLDANKMD